MKKETNVPQGLLFLIVQDNWMTFSLYIRVILIQHYPTSSILPAFAISSLCSMMIYLCFQVPGIARHPSWRLLYLVIPAILDLNIITSRSSTLVLPQFHNSNQQFSPLHSFAIIGVPHWLWINLAFENRSGISICDNTVCGKSITWNSKEFLSCGVSKKQKCKGQHGDLENS